MGFVFECAPTNALTWGLFVACLERNVLRTFESTISLSFQREKPSNNNSEFLSFFKNPFVILICLLWLLEGRSNSSSAINARTDDGVGLLYACPNPTIRYEIWKGPKLKVASYTYNSYLLTTYLIYNAYTSSFQLQIHRQTQSNDTFEKRKKYVRVILHVFEDICSNFRKKIYYDKFDCLLEKRPEYDTLIIN